MRNYFYSNVIYMLNLIFIIITLLAGIYFCMNHKPSKYTEFLDWQRSQGIRCPVLYLQKTYDAQGKPVYKVRPSVSDLQGGLPPTGTSPNPTSLIDATRNDPPYNTNSYPAYDQSSFYVGSTTPLDQMDETQDGLLYSPNAMDTNWGGAEFTQTLVDKGYYAGNEVNHTG